MWVDLLSWLLYARKERLVKRFKEPFLVDLDVMLKSKYEKDAYEVTI